MLPSIADVDLHNLSDQGRETLKLIALPLEAGSTLDDLAYDFDSTKKQLQWRLDLLGAELRNLAGGFQLPKLTGEDFMALLESIRELGQLVPILVDANGRIIDGHTRMRACRDLGLEPVTRVLEWVTTDDQRQSLALVVNFARRQLPASAKRGVALAALLREPSSSNREIAVHAGVSHTLVNQLRRELEDTGALERVSSVVGGDGVERDVSPQRARAQSGTGRASPTGLALVSCPQCGHEFDPKEA